VRGRRVSGASLRAPHRGMYVGVECGAAAPVPLAVMY
jgi:hypothetical protein